jgi:hypothetical protein
LKTKGEVGAGERRTGVVEERIASAERGTVAAAST